MLRRTELKRTLVLWRKNDNPRAFPPVEKRLGYRM